MNGEKSIKKSYWIKELIEMAREGDFVLPEIQREFVWDLRRIADLWDSIYRGYPIGQLLFWDAEASVPLYDFNDANNEKKFLFINSNPVWHHAKALDKAEALNKIIVLDGQQRLTSLFLGAREEGVFAQVRKNSPVAKKMRLCLYVGKEDIENEASEIKLFDWKVDGEEGEDYLPISTILYDKAALREKKIKGKRYVRNFLSAIDKNRDNKVLVDRICFEDSVKVVEVFHRLNSGGKNMDMSELFLSLLFGNGEKSGKGTDIRKKLEMIRLAFGEDFDVKDSTITQLLRFVFVDDSTGLTKVDYSEGTYGKISGGLDDILKAVERTVEFLNKECGIYAKDEMTSHSLFLPLVYIFYLKRKTGVSEQLRAEMKCFTYRALVFNLFAKSTTAILARLKKSINAMTERGSDCFIESLDKMEKDACFPDVAFEDGRVLVKTDTLWKEISRIVEKEKKGQKTNQILLLLSQEPKNTKESKMYDQDHLFAKDLFAESAQGTNLRDQKRFGVGKDYSIEEKERLVSDEDIRRWETIPDKYVSVRDKLGNAVDGKFNTLPNLWLLEQSLNKQKGKKILNVWIELMEKEMGEEFVEGFYRDSLIENRDIDYLRLANFRDIFDKRKGAIQEKLYKLLELPKHIR